MRPILATATSFQGREPLTNEVMRRYAPSIFAESAHTSRSDRYAYIPTVEIVEGLRKEGFQPFFVAQSRTRHEDRREYTKHMLRLRHASTIPSAEAQEVVLINSHDGTSAYQMTAGVLRFVCMNGLILGDNVESIKVPHKGDVKNQVIEGAYEVVKSFTSVRERMSEMKETTLTPAMAEAYAEAALTLRYDTEEKAAPVTISQVLQPRRAEDAKPDLWSTLNRVQENLVRGGLSGTATRGRRTRTRAVTGIDQNFRLNRALWTLSERMADLVNGRA
jgi:Domain of unknown function (DUF932)